jgi:hypothetical protein
MEGRVELRSNGHKKRRIKNRGEMTGGDNSGKVYDNESEEISIIFAKGARLVPQNQGSTYRPVVPRLPTRASLRQ